MDLPQPPSADDLLESLERLKNGLISQATGGSIEEAEYRRLRKQLLGHPELKDRVPRFLKTCRSVSDFWTFIKGEFGTYAERRIYIAAQFNPLLDDLETGEAIVGNTYERIEPPLGAGGFGQVVRYRHRLLDIDFAFKIFAPAFSQGGEGHLERFFREARILFQLQHPNIIRVYDVSMIGRRPFIRMEYFDGKPLNTILREHGHVRPDRALWLVRSVADALRYAHEDIGVMHRDVKPSNIMVKPGELRVIDFGLGVFIEQDLISRITRTGEHPAGGHYTAPELISDPQRLDPRSDIYSLGAVWYEMLVGRPPAAVRDVDSLVRVGVPDEHAVLVLACLTDIDDRIPSMAALLRKLEGLEVGLE